MLLLVGELFAKRRRTVGMTIIGPMLTFVSVFGSDRVMKINEIDSATLKTFIVSELVMKFANIMAATLARSAIEISQYSRPIPFRM